MTKKRTAPEIIGFHLGWDIADVKYGRYQRYASPAVYVCGNSYFCVPTAAQKLPDDFEWNRVGEYYGRVVYMAKGDL